MFVDDTERRAAEEAVRRSESLLSHLVATSPDVITLTERDSGRFAMVNDTFVAVTGYRREEVIGRTSQELGLWLQPQDRPRVVQALKDHGALKDVSLQFVGKHGRTIQMLVSIAPFEMDGRDYLVVNGRDVTEVERTRMEHEAILQNASIGIAFTRNRRIVQANAHFEQMLGWPRGTLVGQPARVVWASEEEFRSLGSQIGRRLAAGEGVEIERTMSRRDGSQFICRLLAKSVDPQSPGNGTIWIVEDITERRMLDQALAKARDDAEAASRAKSAFLANTSHELRTPLNGLVGLARLARQPDLDEPQRGHYLEQISESAETLSAIINDILDLSKIEAGKLLIENVGFDLHALLQTQERAFGLLAQARGLSLALQLHADVPRHVTGDPVRVRQILGNYLSNALKFTAQGWVRLEARHAGGNRLRFEVRDSGPGIDAATQARLFQPFTQADQSTTRRYGGTGLGLSICQELATLMGGEVGVHSRPGEGSCFWVELPLPVADAQAARSNLAPLDDADPLRGAHVLMVEDNVVNMMIAVALLEQWGVRVAQAGNGSQAIDVVEQAQRDGRPFDAVLMDVQMPEMGGHEATRILRQRYDAHTLPVIALTAAALVSERD
jgi:PAS domain S-box-containing protein